MWFILRGASCFNVLPYTLSPCFYIPFSIVVTPLREERAGLCASRAIACVFCTCLFLFFIVFLLGVGGWLRFVIVGLPGFFY